MGDVVVVASFSDGPSPPPSQVRPVFGPFGQSVVSKSDEMLGASVVLPVNARWNGSVTLLRPQPLAGQGLRRVGGGPGAGVRRGQLTGAGEDADRLRPSPVPTSICGGRPPNPRMTIHFVGLRLHRQMRRARPLLLDRASIEAQIRRVLVVAPRLIHRRRARRPCRSHRRAASPSWPRRRSRDQRGSGHDGEERECGVLLGEHAPHPGPRAAGSYIRESPNAPAAAYGARGGLRPGGQGEDGEVQGDQALAECRDCRRAGPDGPLRRPLGAGLRVGRPEGVHRARQGVDQLGGDAAAAVLDEAADRAAVEAVEVADALRRGPGRGAVGAETFASSGTSITTARPARSISRVSGAGSGTCSRTCVANTRS